MMSRREVLVKVLGYSRETAREKTKQGRIGDYSLEIGESRVKEVQAKVRDHPWPAAQTVEGEAALSDKD